MAALEQVFQQPFRFAHAAEPAWVDSVESIALQLSATPVDSVGQRLGEQVL